MSKVRFRTGSSKEWPEAVRHPAPARRRPTRVAVDPAARSRWIEAFYVAEAKAELGRQTAATANHWRTR